MAAQILLADADAFFVAVARMCDPEGAGRNPLLIVGGSGDRRGVVCSASYEARRFGVRSAMPTATALRLCPQALVVPVPRQACQDKSAEIAQVLAQFAPCVEAASIDEWYLDLTGTAQLHGDSLRATALRIRQAVLTQVGLPLSLGGGTNKLVAKLAVELAKRPPAGAQPGAHIVPDGEEAAFMTRFQLCDIPQVGPRLTQRLAELGLRSVADAQRYSEEALRGLLGARLGSWLHARIYGRCEEVVAPREGVQSVGREETFAVDLYADAELERELLSLLSLVMAELRRMNLRARTLTVKVKDPDFTQRQRARTLPVAVESERTLWPIAQVLLSELREARRTGVRLLGVSLSSLVSTEFAEEQHAAPSSRQLELFAQPAGSAAPVAAEVPPTETERDRAVGRLRDALREKFGSDVLRPAMCSSEVRENAYPPAPLLSPPVSSALAQPSMQPLLPRVGSTPRRDIR